MTLRLGLSKIETRGSLVLLMCRDADTRARVLVQVSDFKPYFFVPSDERGVAEDEGWAVEESPLVGVDETPLVRVVCDSPGQVPNRRSRFSCTYQGDFPFARCFLAHTGLRHGFVLDKYEVVGEPNPGGVTVVEAGFQAIRPDDSFEVPLRVVQYDIETRRHGDEYSPPLEANGQVTAITLHDSYDPERIVTLLWHPVHGKPLSPRVEVRRVPSEGLGRDVDWVVRWYGTEDEMLLGWCQHLKNTGPDVLAAWNGHHGFHRRNRGGFDAPYLITRLNKVGVGARQMSPLGAAACGYGYVREDEEDKKPLWYCRVDGMQLVDLMTTFSIQEGGFTAQVPFLGLKDVAAEYAGMHLPKDYEGLDTRWQYDTEAFLDYAFKDVDALVALDRVRGFVAWAHRLQRFTGVEDPDVVFRPLTMVDSLLVRLARARGVVLPTAVQRDEEDEVPTGGHHFEPKMPGVHRNVVALDLKRMYVSIIQSCNISYETWVPPDEVDALVEAGVPLSQVPSDRGVQFFRLDRRGISPTVLDELVGLRAGFDAKIANAKGDTALVKALKEEREPVKQLILSAYGTMLNVHNRLYRPEAGRAVTGAGRHIIQHVGSLVEDMGLSLLRGFTDSVFVLTPEEDDPVEFGEFLTTAINESFNDVARSMGLLTHNFEVGFETVYGVFAHGREKNQYVGRVTWLEGSPVDPAAPWEPVVKGLEGIKTSASPLTEELTDEVIRLILSGVPAEEVAKRIRETYQEVLAGKVPVDRVARGMTLGFDPAKDKRQLAQLEAARYGTERYGYRFEVGSRLRLVKMRGPGPTWLGVPEGMDVPSDAGVDWAYHAKAAVLAPLRGVTRWLGVEGLYEAIRTGSRMGRQQRLSG